MLGHNVARDFVVARVDDVNQPVFARAARASPLELTNDCARARACVRVSTQRTQTQCTKHVEMFDITYTCPC